MTVDKIVAGAAEGPVQCVWFNDADELMGASFHAAQLVLLKKAEEF